MRERNQISIVFDDGQLTDICEAIKAVSYAIHCLGNGDAATPMGGMEALGKVIQDTFADLPSAIEGLAIELKG